MEVASPDLEKQGFSAVVFVNREYNGQPDPQGHAIKEIENLTRVFVVLKVYHHYVLRF